MSRFFRRVGIRQGALARAMRQRSRSTLILSWRSVADPEVGVFPAEHGPRNDQHVVADGLLRSRRGGKRSGPWGRSKKPPGGSISKCRGCCNTRSRLRR